MTDLFPAEMAAAFLQVVLIDIALAGDNAVIIALAAAGLPRHQRARAILAGIVAATLLRISFAAITVQLLRIVGLVLAGGLLLLWVCWKMWREMHPDGLFAAWRNRRLANGPDFDASSGRDAATSPAKSFPQAIFQIVLADASMSLDNVLAVAGAARAHPVVLVFGLTLSVALMGFAAMLISRLLQRHRWIAYLGLAIILFVAVEMIVAGGEEILPLLRAAEAPAVPA